MKNNFISILIQLVCLLLISNNVHSSDDVGLSLLKDFVDIEFLDEHSSCADQYESNNSEARYITSSLILTGEAFFTKGEMIISSTNVRAIVDSYESSSNKLIYYQTAETGFKSFSLGEKLFGSSENVSIVKEFIVDLVIPCSDLVVSIEENPEQMVFVFTDSDEVIKANLAAQEMMAEIEAEMLRQAALDAFLQKIADEKTAAVKSTTAYQSKRLNDAKVKALLQELSLEKVISEFEDKLEAELAAQEMMAEIEAEMARQAALDAFLQKIADEKAAAAASTAEYQAKLAYDLRVNKIMDDLIVQLEEHGITDDYKSTIADELINEATEKLEDEKFIGTISGEIVTVAIHDFCKTNLGLSDSNIELFKKALEGGYLGNVGPQVTNGTEFSSNRWDDYIDCVGSKRI